MTGIRILSLSWTIYDAFMETLDLFHTRYEGGVDTHLQVITSQTAALESQCNNIEIQLRLQQARVLLIKALGGGWSTQQLPPG
jgi:outer membrane protein TolC